MLRYSKIVNKLKYLVIDIGNTLCKIAIFSGEELIFFTTFDTLSLDKIKSITEKYKKIDSAIISSTSTQCDSLKSDLEALGIDFVEVFSYKTPVPIKNLYSTPLTLGLDRIASAVAASEQFPKKDIIIFDLGTAMTIDYVTKDGEFIGGNISPGISMRFKALNHYTERLPLIDNDDFKLLFSKYLENIDDNIKSNFATSTLQAIFNGVIEGILGEIESYIEKNREKIIFFTGGDALYFEKLIKIPIFVDWQATIKGLRVILERLSLERLC